MREAFKAGWLCGGGPAPPPAERALERERSMLWEIKLADSIDALQAVCGRRLREIDKHFK